MYFYITLAGKWWEKLNATNKKGRFALVLCGNGGPSGTRTPDQPVMSRLL